MKKTVKTLHQLKASPDIVWQQIKHGKEVNKWLPMITACKLEGEGAGAKRICSTAQGDMKETILKIDNDERVFQYSIDQQPLLPIENIIGTMQIQSKNGGSELLWDLEFDLLDENSYLLIKQTIEGMYAAGANGLESLSQPKKS